MFPNPAYIPLGTMLLAFLAAWRFRWRDYMLPARFLSRRGGEDSALSTAATQSPHYETPWVSDNRAPRVSIIIPCHNESEAIAENLPEMLRQCFDIYEVIVVDEASTDNTPDVLKRLEKEFPHLRRSFVPRTARYVCRRKLAITLGIRSARAPWVIITEADCRPAGQYWLRTMAKNFTEDIDFVLGYANYIDNGTREARRACYERLRHNLMCFRSSKPFISKRKNEIQYRGQAIGGNGANLALRRSFFLEKKGYEASLNVPLGEDDLLVNALSQPGHTAIEPSPEASVWQRLPSSAVLRTQRVNHRETLKRLNRRGHLFLYREGAATIAIYLFIISLFTFIALRIRYIAQATIYNPETDLPMDILGFGVTCCFALTPYLALRRTTRALGERNFSWFIIAGYALIAPWRHFSQKVKHFWRRHEFVKKM